VGHIVNIGRMRYAYRIVFGTAEGRDHLQDLVMNGIILKWILKMIGINGSSLEYGNESSGYMNGGKNLDQLNDCWLLKKDLFYLVKACVTQLCIHCSQVKKGLC
jgi:hypothetical protein